MLLYYIIILLNGGGTGPPPPALRFLLLPFYLKPLLLFLPAFVLASAIAWADFRLDEQSCGGEKADALVRPRQEESKHISRALVRARVCFVCVHLPGGRCEDGRECIFAHSDGHPA